MNSATTLVLERDARAGGAVLLHWVPSPSSGSLAGRATIDFHGWVVNGIPVFHGRDGGKPSVGVPSAPEVRDGQHHVVDGKKQYRPMMNFTGTGKARWEHMVLEALARAGVAV